MAGFRHPNIVTVFDSGVLRDGQRYCVMEYVRGRAISEHVRREGMGLSETLALFARVCDGVQYAHQRGVMHRDLKPSNILVDHEGTPKILDFGLAKRVEAAEETVVSMTGELIGTLKYASPEQVSGSGEGIDTRSDVYALGVVLYELLTGEFPYPVGGSTVDVIRNISMTEPLRPSSGRSRSGAAGPPRGESPQGDFSIDGELDTIVLKALAKDPARRYQSVGELGRDIRHYLAGDPIEARRDSTWYVLRKAMGKHRVAVGAAGLLALTLIVSTVVIWSVYQGKNASDRQLIHQNYAKSIQLTAEALADRNAPAMRGHLDGCPIALRGFEWYRLDALSDNSVLTISNVGRSPQRFSISPEGKRVAVASHDAFVRIYSLRTGALEQTLETAQSEIYTVAFSPDEIHLAAGGSGKAIEIWDLSTGVKESFPAHRATVVGLQYIPDGSYLVSSGQDTLAYLWDVNTKERVREFKGQEGSALAIAVSPDGRWLATAGNSNTADARDNLRLWDLKTGGDARSLIGRDGDIMDIDFTGDSKRLVSVGDDGVIYIWDVLSGEIVSQSDPLGMRLVCAAFHPDGKRIAFSGTDGVIRTWDPQTKVFNTVQIGHLGQINSLSYTTDGSRLVSVSDDKTLKMWLTDPPEYALVLAGHWREVNAAAVSPDGETLATGGRDHTVRVWDRRAGKLLKTLHGHQQDIHLIAFTDDGTMLISASGNGVVQLHDTSTWKSLASLDTHDNQTFAVGFSGGPYLATGNKLGVVQIWDLKKRKVITTLPTLSADEIRSFAFDSSGTHLAVGDDSGMIGVWEWRSGTEIFKTHAHDGMVGCLAFSPDEAILASGGEDASIVFWNARYGERQAQLAGHEGPVNSVAFSPDGQRLVSGAADKSVMLWTVTSGDSLLTLDGHTGIVTSVGFFPSGDAVFSTAKDGTARVWESRALPVEQYVQRRNQTIARRKALSLFDDLSFADAVGERLKKGDGLDEVIRDIALEFAVAIGDTPEALNNQAWSIALEPNAKREEYELALKRVNRALDYFPGHMGCLNTKGVALLRTGDYERALEILLDCDAHNRERGGDSQPADVAFIGMALCRLGRIEEAERRLGQLRDLLDGDYEDNDMYEYLLVELEDMIAGGCE